ncbi:MAG: DUF4350 domain-containing protein [Mycobacteriales bacterium]
MSVLDERPLVAETYTGETVRSSTRKIRGPLAVAAALVVAAVLAALLRTAATGQLDPRAYDPAGSRAIAALLEQRGVPVRVVETVAGLSTGPDSTVVVPFPDGLSTDELATLGKLPSTLVMLGAGRVQLIAAGLPDVSIAAVQVEQRRPACALQAAVNAGAVDLGGLAYRPPAGSSGCYASGGRATLVTTEKPPRVLLGSGALLTNERLGERGNAALALSLLGGHSEVQWLLPRPGARDLGERRGLNALLPDSIRLAAMQLLLATIALVLWRARRLGPVVTEPLPVVVRAAEAAEGRSRLYRAARARGRAAEALREGARERLARRLGLARDSARTALVDAVATRTGRPAHDVDGLLYGAEPGEDSALVQLADDLDTLDREVADS